MTKPDAATAAIKAGLAALDTGQEREVLPIVAAAVATHPRDARLRQVAGLLYRSLDELGSAVEAMHAAVTLAPTDTKIAHGLAQTTFEAGLPAAHLFEAARKLAPMDSALLLGSAAAQFAEGHQQMAIEALDRALMAQPQWLEGHWLLARLRFADGDHFNFTASLKRALKSAPRDPLLWQQLVFTYMHAELYADALSAILAAHGAVGNHFALDANEAACLSELGRLDEAERRFSVLPSTHDIAVAIHRIRHFLRTGRPNEALECAAPFAAGSAANMVVPYVSLAWRLLGDRRWEWLEGDARLVGVYDIGGDLPSTDGLAAHLRSLHVAAGQPLEQSVRGGTQTDGPLLSRIEPEIQALRQAILKAVGRHVAQLPAHDPRHPFLSQPRDRRLRISGSWSVRLRGGGHHANHVHPGGWISSAFYAAIPPASKTGPTHAGWLTLGQPQDSLRLDLPAIRSIEPKPGRLILFPSTIWHGTVPFSTGERLTVAFDIARPA